MCWFDASLFHCCWARCTNDVPHFFLLHPFLAVSFLVPLPMLAHCGTTLHLIVFCPDSTLVKPKQNRICADTARLGCTVMCRLETGASRIFHSAGVGAFCCLLLARFCDTVSASPFPTMNMEMSFKSCFEDAVLFPTSNLPTCKPVW